jgi:hypothetical protein
MVQDLVSKCCRKKVSERLLLTVTYVAQVWKIKLTIVFPWQLFEYYCLISLQNLLWHSGSTDMCVKGNTAFSGKEKDLPEPPENWMVARRGWLSPSNGWDSKQTKWTNQRAKIRICQCHIIRSFPALLLFLPFVLLLLLILLLLLLLSPPPLLCMTYIISHS